MNLTFKRSPKANGLTLENEFSTSENCSQRKIITSLNLNGNGFHALEKTPQNLHNET